ncbi:MAG: hypothetical protein AMJ78_06485 [Omnitrophica WOR_2 bacterium SM23_29]|nr:MAG: hypothetical protein AMJ78_06485 [Omnitrophica WOR_2 bacterium SM23_29]
MRILFIVKDIDFIDSIGIMLLSSLAKKNNHDTYLGILNREDIIKKINEIRPQVIAYSATTGEHKYYIAINKIIKSKFNDIFTIMGGAHTTFYPECINQSSLDAICVGEGEGAFTEVLGKVERGEDVSSVKNIRTGSVPFIGVRNLVEELDNLPFPDRELFYKDTEMGQFPLKSFMTSRGCPYDCTYCFNHSFRKLYDNKGKILRRHSVNYVIDEILQVKKKYPLKFVKFYDDIFVYGVDEWLEEFAKRYKRDIDLPFHCLTRADLVDEETIRLLKSAGCLSISMSIEAGNAYFRNQVLKRDMTEEQILRAFQFCQKYGIKTFSNSIIGLPFSKLENEIESVDMNIKCRVAFVEFPIFHPYPRTELGDFCIEKGIYKPQYELLHMFYMNRSPLTCFSEREKNVQRNLAELGPLVVWLPFLRGIVLKYLIYFPNNKIFVLIYYFVKAYLVKTKIYPMRVGMKNSWRAFLKSLRLELFKHSDEQLSANV